MTGKKLLALVAVGGLGMGLAATPATAKKKCKKLCRDDIAACKAANCAPLTKGRRKCNRTCKRDAIELCRSRPDTTTCSPSGAFLDPAL